MIEVLLVTAPGCHFCTDARAALLELATSFPVAVREIDAASSEGLDAVERHRPALWPLVLVDGAYFSSGRLPRTKLRSLLSRSTSAA